MALIFNAALTSTITDFDGVQANGIFIDPRGLSAPIPGWVEINSAPDGTQAMMSCITPSDTLTYGGIRSEIDYVPEANGERWYVWDMFIPAGFAGTETITFMQIHDSPDGGESPVKYPNFEFQTHGGKVFCAVPVNCPSETTSNGRPPAQKMILLVTGRWVTCALHANWGTDSTGFMEAFYDGKLLSKEWSRACGFTDAVGPYWKLGLYDFTHGGITSTYRAWYRNARLYSTGHSALDMLGTIPRLTDATQVMRIA